MIGISLKDNGLLIISLYKLMLKLAFLEQRQANFLDKIKNFQLLYCGIELGTVYY